MNINKKAVILILIIVVCVIISALISNREHLNAGAPIGGRCKRSSDCANHSGIDKITCCTANGFDNPVTEWGVCTKPCINGNVGWCPSEANKKSLTCKKNLGETCNENQDCIGWGFNRGGKGIKCVNNRCAISSYDSNIFENRFQRDGIQLDDDYKFDFDSQTDTSSDKTYLYSTRNTDLECREKGLFGAFMPQVCNTKNGLDKTKNCKCVDRNGICKICYAKRGVYDNTDEI